MRCLVCGYRIRTDKRGRPLRERHKNGSHHKKAELALKMEVKCG